MDLSFRIRSIILENDLKQKEFAKSINVTESYISKLLRGESGLSNSTALLIEEKFGYSANWIISGLEPKKRSISYDITPIQQKIITDIQQMDNHDLAAVKAFICSLSQYKKELGLENKK